MKKSGLLLLLLVSSVLLIAQNGQKERLVIKEIIQTAYVDGLQNEGDIDKIDYGFHPDFIIFGIGVNNEMWKLSIQDWKEKVEKGKNEGKLPRSGDDLESIKFLKVDVNGTSAVAKIEFYVGEKLKYIDYISLYKFDNGWKIVSKIFYKLVD